jgi:hypothetical protein
MFTFVQVSHHPPVSAFYVTNRQDGFCISASILAKSKFYGILLILSEQEVDKSFNLFELIENN